MNYIFKSDRLGFRHFSNKDIDELYEINSNPEIMQFFLKRLNKLENNIFANKIKDHEAKYGYSLFSVDLLETNEFIGLIGLLKISFDISVKNQIEIGWRLSNKYWHRGYAQEGAKAVLNYGFNSLHLETIYSFTSLLNHPSENVMKKIGMDKLVEFNHPLVEKNHPLYPHVLYVIHKNSFNASYI